MSAMANVDEHLALLLVCGFDDIPAYKQTKHKRGQLMVVAMHALSTSFQRQHRLTSIGQSCPLTAANALLV
jgi:hypothetical protein